MVKNSTFCRQKGPWSQNEAQGFCRGKRFNQCTLKLKNKPAWCTCVTHSSTKIASMDVQNHNFTFPLEHWAGRSSGSPSPQWQPHQSLPGRQANTAEPLPGRARVAAVLGTPVELSTLLSLWSSNSRVTPGHRLQHGAGSASWQLWHSGRDGRAPLQQAPGTRHQALLPQHYPGLRPCFVPGYWTQDLFLILQHSPHAPSLGTGGRGPAHTDTDLHKIMPPSGQGGPKEPKHQVAGHGQTPTAGQSLLLMVFAT